MANGEPVLRRGTVVFESTMDNAKRLSYARRVDDDGEADEAAL